MHGYRPNPELRQAIRRRDHGICQQCGAPGTDVAHIVPWPDGPSDDASNLRLLCTSCNHRERRRLGYGHPVGTDAIRDIMARALVHGS